MNKVMISGRLTKDVDISYSKKGTPWAKTSIAINEYYTDQQGVKNEKVTFIDLKLFNKNAENAKDILGKGDKVIIEGQLNQEKWVDRNGNNKYAISVIVQRFELVQKKYVATPENSNYDPMTQGYQGSPEPAPSFFPEDVIPF
jgi:single-strand DNA-binding protein